jgi:hypothetical protein
VNSRSISAIVFWIVFAAAIAFAPHHTWLRYGFALSILAFLLVSTGWYLISVIRNPQRALSDHGYPRRFLRFAHDDERKLTRSDRETS